MTEDTNAVTTVSPAAALPLLRRAAASRGVAWPSDPQGATAAGGFRLAVTGRMPDETVAWATLDGKNGILGVLAGDRPLSVVSDNLGAITAVQPVRLPGLPGHALMVDDRNDEMVGAFLREDRRRLYVWDGRALREVYRGILHSEQYQHAQWQNPRAPNLWRLERITGEIALRDGHLQEHTLLSHLEAPGAAQAPVPPASAFRVRTQQERVRRFHWDPRLRRFAEAHTS